MESLSTFDISNKGALTIDGNFNFSGTSTTKSQNNGDIIITGNMYVSTGSATNIENTKNITAPDIYISGSTNFTNWGTVNANVHLDASSTWTGNAPVGNLPVELLYFTAISTNGTILCKWATASETNNDKFIIEESTDGITFTPIKYINGAGNSDETNVYEISFSPNKISGTYYLQLVQEDYNGNRTIEKTEAISLTSTILLYPNSVAKGEPIFISKELANTSIFNANGNLMMNSIEGNSINTSLLESGYYILMSSEGSQKFHIR